MGRADVYAQPDAPDPLLEPATVVGLARRHVAGARAVTAVDESGGEARVYMVDGGIVVKTQRPHRVRPRTSLRKEMLLLEALATAGLDGRVPSVFGYDTVDTAQGRVEYLCMSRVPGCAFVVAPPVGRAGPGVLTDLAAILRVVHRVRRAGVDGDALSACGLFPEDAQAADLRRRFELAFGDLEDAVAGSGRAWPLALPLADVAREALELLPIALPPPVPLHSNPGPTHTFIDPQSRSLTGLIDFGDSYLSHPALDLRSWPDPADRQLLYEAYRTDHDPGEDFSRVWTVAMIHADARAVVSGSSAAAGAARALMARLA